MMTTEFKMPEPVAIVESWTNGSYGRSYKLAWQDNADTGDALYKSSDMRAVIEQCAQICNSYSVDRRALYKGRPPYKGNEPGRADQYTDGQSDGADVEKFLQREPQPMPLGKAEELAHRTASRYTHKSDRSFTAYTFLPHTLNDFVRKIEQHHGIG